MASVSEKILETARRKSVFRAADVSDVSDPRSTIYRLVEQGTLIRVGPGLYSLVVGDVGRHHGLVEATSAYPGGVICLISALVFHELGTQMPYETWMMRNDRKKAPPAKSGVRFVYSTGQAFRLGIESHTLEGIPVLIYSPAKTIADCFKYRNKIGLDVAVEALRDGWEGKRFSMDELWRAAKSCRVQGVMRPYIEMVAS